MTTEEIEKVFSSHIANYEKMIGRSTRDMRQTILLHFTQGVNASDKHWQEKTRWIPVEEGLPEVKSHPYQILVKNKSVHTMYIASQYDIALLKGKCLGFTHWKEIE